MNSLTRTILVASALPQNQARAVLTVICRAARESLEKKRDRLTSRFHKAVVRVVKFAKHETLRKLHRHLYSNRPLMGQDEPLHHDATRIAFNADELTRDLGIMLATESQGVLNSAVTDTLAAAGFRDPWKLPAQAALDFVARRQNLLSGVSDEIFQTIRNEISAGLIAGESISELSARIGKAFNEIETGRAEVIAKTETAAAYAYASDQAARAAGIEYKQWLHGATSKVPRPDHVAIDRLIVPIDQPFPVGTPPLMYPHDGNGSPQDVINCSCISIPVTRADFEAQ